MGVQFKCLKLINKLKKKNMDKKFFNKKKYKIKGIMYGNKINLKKVENMYKCFSFNPKVLEINNGPICKLSFNKTLNSVIGKKEIL
jgi:hypothetical protein